MKGLMFFLIFPMLVIFSIGVFAINGIIEKEAHFDPERPWAGTYRVALEAAPADNAAIHTTSYTHSKPVRTDEVEYPFVRIEYYASANIGSLNESNGGTYYIDVEVPRKAVTSYNPRYDRVFFDGRTRQSTLDIRMGSPDIEMCKANSRMNDDNGFSCEAKIPW
ncbi:MAG: hypothetical protein OXI67_10050 [Candidatus Poribacteria bacterium]|nr:hypothetical protein [Candidatus Poribacteria bacterium]